MFADVREFELLRAHVTGLDLADYDTSSRGFLYSADKIWELTAYTASRAHRLSPATGSAGMSEDDFDDYHSDPPVSDCTASPESKMPWAACM